MGQPTSPEAAACSRAAAAAAGEAAGKAAATEGLPLLGVDTPHSWGPVLGPGGCAENLGFLAGAPAALPCLLADMALMTKLLAILLAADLAEEAFMFAPCCLGLPAGTAMPAAWPEGAALSSPASHTQSWYLEEGAWSTFQFSKIAGIGVTQVSHVSTCRPGSANTVGSILLVC